MRRVGHLHTLSLTTYYISTSQYGVKFELKTSANTLPFVFTVDHKPTVDEPEVVYEQALNVPPVPVSDISNRRQSSMALEIPKYDAQTDYAFLYHKMFQENERALQQYDALLA